MYLLMFYLVPVTLITHLPLDILILCEIIVLPVLSILGAAACLEYIIKWTIFSRVDVGIWLS